MRSNDTLILRAGLAGETSVYRDIEIEPSKSLYRLAEAIVTAFGFDFDHAFGFYSRADDHDDACAAPIRIVRRYGRCLRRASSASRRPGFRRRFRRSGHTMMFLFDYGDD